MADHWTRPWEDTREPGRVDVDGIEWWACDPYPHWFRYEVPGDRSSRIAERNHPPPRFRDEG